MWEDLRVQSSVHIWNKSNMKIVCVNIYELLQGRHMFTWDTLLCLFEENLHTWISVELESLDFKAQNM